MSEKSRKEQIQEMLQEDPNDSFLHYGLAMELLSEGSEEEAKQELQALLEKDPDYVATYLQLGQLHQRLDEEEQARQIFKRGIAVAQKQGNEHAASEMTSFLAMISED